MKAKRIQLISVTCPLCGRIGRITKKWSDSNNHAYVQCAFKQQPRLIPCHGCGAVNRVQKGKLVHYTPSEMKAHPGYELAKPIGLKIIERMWG